MAFRQLPRTVSTSVWALATCLTAAFSTVQGQADAAAISGSFAVRGLGAQSCRDISALATGDKADDLIQLSAAWIAGYLSQFNRGNSDTYEAVPIVDNVVLGKLAINICRSNPDILFEAVAASLVTSFSRGVLAEESPIVELKSGKNSAMLRRASFRLVQQELIEQGYLPGGGADGDYGPASRAALSKYQEARGITTTGVPDAQTLIHLFAMGGTDTESGRN